HFSAVRRARRWPLTLPLERPRTQKGPGSSRRRAAWPDTDAARLRLARGGVVLLVVDVLRFPVLFPVDLLLFARGQLAAVGGAVRGHLVIDGLLLAFQLPSLFGRQRAAGNALCDAVLLVLAALADFVIPVVRGIGVVLVVVNLPGGPVVLPVELGFIGRSQVAVVLGAHFVRLFADGPLAVLQVLGLAGGQLAALNALGDALLLEVAPRSRGRLRRGRLARRRGGRARGCRSRSGSGAGLRAGRQRKDESGGGNAQDPGSLQSRHECSSLLFPRIHARQGRPCRLSACHPIKKSYSDGNPRGDGKLRPCAIPVSRMGRL